jgi:integrase/recombinase XerD
MSVFKDLMTKNMQLKGFSPRTRSHKYLTHLRQFEEFFNSPAEALSQEEVRDFLHYLINEKKVSRSYANGVYSGLKFFFDNTLARPWDLKQLPRIKKAKILPVVLSHDEIKRLLTVTTNLKV